MSQEKKGQGSWVKVFCPDARCLSEAEVASLPPEQVESAQGDKKEGLWLELFCPEGACATGPEKYWTMEETKDQAGGKGLWLKLFCPEDSCQVNESTEEP
jgi:hypothetical protein